ncbi:MAG: hypothetical protein IJK42_05965 [Prevotella sp.]|nr:hypothetical protein [Prevotella sp.]
MGRNTYFYIAYTCSVIKDGHYGRLYSAICYKTYMESNSSGIPTMGTMEGLCRRAAERDGVEYVEGTFVILNIMRLTKSQYERLQSGEDCSDRAFPL